MAKMEWNKLLCKERQRPTLKYENDIRNEFERDYDRIVGSSSLRRLQDKTQVFPLQENDFTRTRLTHSLEVSAMARSMGKKIGIELVKQGKMNQEEAEELASLLAVCGLVHDLGNPPFGHYGEDIIRNWFQKHSQTPIDTNCCLFNEDDRTWINDYLCFDGNAQTLRILSKLQYMKDIYGMNFSYGTLATLLKYPYSSSYAMGKNIGKIGYFHSEEELFNKIVNCTGQRINNDDSCSRHPATYILEAADDISYLFADLEDAVKKGIVAWENLKSELYKVKGKTFSDLENRINNIKETNQKNFVPYQDRAALEAMEMRIYCQGICIKCVCEEFLSQYENIMDGKYSKKSLCKCEKLKSFIDSVKDISSKFIYGHKEVLSLELIGKSVINSLLDNFIKAALDTENYDNTKTESGKLFQLISSNYRHIQNIKDGVFIEEKSLSKQERIQLVIDFISGMSDSYALNLHKMLLGMKLP